MLGAAEALGFMVLEMNLACGDRVSRTERLTADIFCELFNIVARGMVVESEKGEYQVGINP